jgi:hypothetical protein
MFLEIEMIPFSGAAVFFGGRSQQSQRLPLTEIMNLRKYIFMIMEFPFI